MFKNVRNFLEVQKKEMLRLDEAEGLRKRELDGRDFVLTNPETGERKGMREILYDNTISWLMSESRGVLFKEFMALAQPGALNEDTLTTSFSTFTTALLPAVRRIYSKLMVMELLSVQPLPAPSGYIYYIDHTFGTTGGGATEGQRLDLYRYPSYANSSEKGTIRDINFQLKSLLVSTTTKKLKAGWTLEAAQDLNSQWKLDLWAEMMPQLTDEISREIDSTLVTALVAGAGAGNVNWNANGYLTDDKSTWEKRQYDQTLYNAIVDANAYIFKKKYVQANWLLMNGDTFARVQKLEKFSADPSITPDQQAQIGWRYEGTLANKFKVYVDPWFTDNKILLGFKGGDWKYACGYYAPYIPVFLSEEYIVSDDFTQRARGAMTRYAGGVVPASDTDPLNYGLATVTITLS